MLNGIFNKNLNPTVSNSKTSGNSTAPISDLNFKNTFVDLAQAAQVAVTEKGSKEDISFGRWRDFEDSLYYDKEEVEEKAALDNLKRLQRVIKEKLGF